ncbi:glycoside hydrolase family 93 protein [Neurospora crassa]|uniref:BNR/Asp-box repeat protein n=1 Tax=Neurospora crassa (strain ATCC 24698 / 74-OR23-1A / CBS 708.71 / DSM 1257 / FGSC 987) TaxID=367110 RepID=Q7RVR3_NEUCR|nr:BNR/Asp-box repeat protein [Neurospora crassa OR74A]EAA28974.1 BNR/Asp-box repeat protein [Neurospora crassa OR74A]KHE84907.1 glycoside hydrolase family 93 protein [Neurospora crassa]|eukprot:XP_958210.1 BNR/Asp-box repeat protein [Neurospora crassa OR74A]
MLTNLKLTTLFLSFHFAVAALAGRCKPDPPPFSTFPRRIIYDPPAGKRASYPRHVELKDGTLLVTSSIIGGDFFAGSNSSFPVFESKDGGVHWKWISNITDQVNGWGMSAQPALLELQKPLGGFRAGTILFSGNSWSENGTRIDLYASTDKARTWNFVSHVAEGGRPNTTNGATPVWEPFLLEYKDELIVYYSDQRDPKHGQKLAHQRSKDLRTWGPVVNDVRYDEYLARPGMTVVAKIETINKWILVHELPVGNSSSYGVNYPVYYHIADEPTKFDSAPGIPIVIDGKLAPNASPYVVWSSAGGPNGTIVVSDADRSEVYTNRFGGDPDKWEMHAIEQPAAYSRALHIFRRDPRKLMVLGGATFDEGGPDELSLSVLNLIEVLKTTIHPA